MTTNPHVLMMRHLQNFFGWTFQSAQHGDYTGVCIVLVVLTLVVMATVKLALNRDWQT